MGRREPRGGHTLKFRVESLELKELHTLNIQHSTLNTQHSSLNICLVPTGLAPSAAPIIFFCRIVAIFRSLLLQDGKKVANRQNTVFPCADC